MAQSYVRSYVRSYPSLAKTTCVPGGGAGLDSILRDSYLISQRSYPSPAKTCGPDGAGLDLTLGDIYLIYLISQRSYPSLAKDLRPGRRERKILKPERTKPARRFVSVGAGAV